MSTCPLTLSTSLLQAIVSPPTPMTRLMKSLPPDGAIPIALPTLWKNFRTGLLGAVKSDSSGQPGGRLNTAISPRCGLRKS